MSADEGVNDGAILLLSLGEERAAEVLKYMSPKEVQKLGAAMAQLEGVPNERVEAVMRRFGEEATNQSAFALKSDDYVRNVLTKALGNDKAGLLIDRILQGSDTSGIESLKWVDPGIVAELIKNEHPQILASILVHLEDDQAAAVLNFFPERLRADVILRIATLDGIQPNALRELNEVLLKTLSASDQLKKTSLGGVRKTAEILNYVGGTSETLIMDAVREIDPDLAQKIIDEMFTFDNLMDIEDRGIQLILREVQSDSLIVALKGASAELREKIFKNMSSRASEMLREDLESKGPVKLSEVEAEQKEILKVVRRLVEEGQISISGKGDDEYV